MTKIDELKGRELDIAIGSILFEHITLTPNWYPLPVECFFNRETGYMEYSYDENACNAMVYRNGANGDDGTAETLPRWHCDIAQAWELLDGYNYAIDTYEFRAEQFGAPVGCYLRNDDGAWLAHGDTVEEAICRTYLKAKAREALGE